jgi:hypothetical protein
LGDSVMALMSLLVIDMFKILMVLSKSI